MILWTASGDALSATNDHARLVRPPWRGDPAHLRTLALLLNICPELGPALTSVPVHTGPLIPESAWTGPPREP